MPELVDVLCERMAAVDAGLARTLAAHRQARGRMFGDIAVVPPIPAGGWGAGLDPTDTDGLLIAAADAWVAGSPATRIQLRAASASAPSLSRRLRRLMHQAASAIGDTDGSREDRMRWLWRGLAAVILEDGRHDVRDTILALDRLFIAAVVAGLDAPHTVGAALDAATATARARRDSELPDGVTILTGYARPDRQAVLARRAAGPTKGDLLRS